MSLELTGCGNRWILSLIVAPSLALFAAVQWQPHSLIAILFGYLAYASYDVLQGYIAAVRDNDAGTRVALVGRFFAMRQRNWACNDSANR